MRIEKKLLEKYGVERQLICGIHLNISVDPKALAFYTGAERNDEIYIRAARHYYKNLDWFLLLVAATPISVESDWNKPVVSLRNSLKGYSSQNYQSYLSLESLDSYIKGIKKGLVNNISDSPSGLISDKEFYAPIRLKQLAQSNETMLQALGARGINHLELRFFDKNPYVEGGIDIHAIELSRLLFFRGMITEEFDIDVIPAIEKAFAVAGLEHSEIAYSGILKHAEEQLLDLLPFARLVDYANPGGQAHAAIQFYLDMIQNPNLLPSVALYQDFTNSRMKWNDFGLELAMQSNSTSLERMYA